METAALHQLFLKHPVISTDTRKIVPGSIFFALKGDKFDANSFAGQAIGAGAAYAVIDNAKYRLGENYILVDDVLSKLQDLARYHRKQLQIPVIGLTGSNGKTTTKELINAVLSQHFKTFATQGNLNNHIGVPLSVLSINDSHQMAVIEMGANHQREIELLCSISQPTHGLITNIGRAHLEGFGGVEGIKIGKGELYDYLKKTDGVTFINADSPVINAMKDHREMEKVVYYGTTGEDNLVTGSIIGNSPYLSLQWHGREGINNLVDTKLTGTYNLENILAAICIGSYFGLSNEEINNGIDNYTPGNNRSQITKTATNTLICDYYNANPSSMALAIENISTMEADQKVMILGDMFEMGQDSPQEHLGIIEKAIAANADGRVFIGKAFYEQKKGFDADFFETTDDAISYFKNHPVKNATVLIKGSRGMALERLVELF